MSKEESVPRIYLKFMVLAKHSLLGVSLGKLSVGAIGQADDTVLMSNDLEYLSHLLDLSILFCRKSLVEISADKTRLQVFLPNNANQKEYFSADSRNSIKIDGKVIPFSDSAEHVGVVRDTSGNGPAIFARFSAHRKALGAVLHQGLAKGHRANPCFSLKIERLYATPVLFSGLGALILTGKETESIENHYRESLRQLLRLHKGTPRCVIYFLAGSLPGVALLHLRQLSLFGMITRLSDNILHKHALNIFSFNTMVKKSWFLQIRQLSLLYDLPHPSTLLEHPRSKLSYKKLTKSRVISYWECKLREEACVLKSIPFFRCSFMSLAKIHPLLSTAGHSSNNVAKSLVQSVMLSGRYRCGALIRHWKRTTMVAVFFLLSVIIRLKIFLMCYNFVSD